ncbi:MAG: CotH kinase family protein [Verrucomicrobia bacterium]|nr:CotH kinase family protein [Verrucomicrobiota bacterium]
MRRYSLQRLLTLATVLSFARVLLGAPEYSAGSGPGDVTDAFDLSRGLQVIRSTPQNTTCCGISDPRAIWGGITAPPWSEPGKAIFADGPGPGFVDIVEWQTREPLHLTEFALRLEQNAPNSAERAASRFRLFASTDGLTFRQISGGTVPSAPGPNPHTPLLIRDRSLLGTPTEVRAFRLELTRATSRGVRVVELDGQGTPVPPTSNFLDRLLFNAVDNSLVGRKSAARDDEGPGTASGFRVSSRLGGVDTPEDAFGNANGPIEPESFIFEDNGVPDNGNADWGDGGETVDFLEWQVADEIPLAGYRLELVGDGASNGKFRSVERVRLFVDGEVADEFDNQAFNGVILRTFADGIRRGRQFRLEFTRSSTGGPRVVEVDALVAPETPPAGELVLNEVVTANQDSTRDEDGDSPDWIELFNGRATPVALAGWGLSDDPDRPFRWVFPDVVLPPRAHLIIYASGKNRRQLGSPLHTNFELKSDGEWVLLTEPNQVRRDQIATPRLLDDLGYGRVPNGVGPWRFLSPSTPARSNGSATAYDSVVYEAPNPSAAAGFHAEPFNLVLHTAEAGVTLHYTLDGSEPTSASPIYRDPLPITSRATDPNVFSVIPGTATANQFTDGWKAPLGSVRKATVVRARALRPGGLPGPILSQSFWVGEAAVSRNLPTVSLLTPPAGLFDYETGIYMLGAVFDRYVKAHPDEPPTQYKPANFTQRGPEWEREGHLEWFDTNGTRVATEPVLIDIQGQSSRSFRQKTFGLKARGPESPRNTFSFPFFPGLTRLGDGGPLTDFRSLRLRNFGNDWDYALMRDDWAHRLAGGLGLNLMSSRYAQVFLDGEYWGILGVREQLDRRYFQAHYGVDDDEVVILDAGGGIIEGQAEDATAWLELLQFCETHSLADPANYAHVVARVDPEDALKYYLSEIYFANADWPQNNLRVWRRRLATPDINLGPGQDGRWRFLLFDVDLGANHPWSAGVSDLTLQAALSPTGRPGLNSPWSTAIFRAFMTHPAWRQEFISTTADLLNSWYQPTRATALVDTMREELRPAMEEHIRRWRGNGGSVAAWELRVRSLRDFALQRSGVLRQQVLSELGLPGTARITLNLTEPDGGVIRVNRLQIDESLPGVRNPVYPWSGFYFQTVPVTLEARPRPGWRFDGWSGPAGTSTNTVFIWNPTITTALTARFVPNTPRLELDITTTHLRLRLHGDPGTRHLIQSSEQLATWQDLTELQVPTGGPAELLLPRETPARQYLRAVTR